LRDFEQVDAIERNAERQLEMLQHEILQNAVGEIDQRLQGLEEDCIALNENLQLLDERIDAAEIACKKIQIQINEVEKAIEKREKAGSGALDMLITIGVCAFVSIVLPEILPELFKGVVAAPVKGGGAKIGPIWTW
jgi:prefoldin subunit 5